VAGAAASGEGVTDGVDCGAAAGGSGVEVAVNATAFTHLDGYRFTAFATDARKGQFADLELRRRRRARCEDRKDPLREGHRPAEPAWKGFAQNQACCEINCAKDHG
jgi:hypothetical protein